MAITGIRGELQCGGSAGAHDLLRHVTKTVAILITHPIYMQGSVSDYVVLLWSAIS